MTLTEMHVMFRQLAQQMGMQNVRAILPEQIDLLINTSISDNVNRIITENIGVTNDRVVTDNSKISQINALRNIYKVYEIELPSTNNYFKFSEEDYLTGLLKDVNSDTSVSQVSNATSGFAALNPMYWVDFSLSYTKGSAGMTSMIMGIKDTNNGFNTPYFPVRLIEDSNLADVLNDFVLKPRFRSPALTIVGNCFYLYIGECSGNDRKYFVKNTDLIPYKFRMSFVDNPRLVKYNIDTGVANIETDMPDYLHVDIVKHAVELWQLSVQGNLATEQNRLRNAQRERIRNNNRSEND